MNIHPNLPPLLIVLLSLLSLMLLLIGLWHLAFVPLALGLIGLYATLALQLHGIARDGTNRATHSVMDAAPASVYYSNSRQLSHSFLRKHVAVPMTQTKSCNLSAGRTNWRGKSWHNRVANFLTKDSSMSPLRHLIVTILLVLICQSPANAETAPYPLDRPALTVHLADGQRLTFTLQQLQKLPQGSIQLRDDEGAMQNWVGVPLHQLLAQIPGADSGRTLHATALNHYSVLVPYEDILHYRPLIAYQLNGRFMPIRDHGPLYLIYPFDDYPELHQQMFYNRSIWQLSEIHIE